jgi:hypothetical protein
MKHTVESLKELVRQLQVLNPVSDSFQYVCKVTVEAADAIVALQSKCDEQAREIEKLTGELNFVTDLDRKGCEQRNELKAKIAAMESQHQLAHKTLQDVLASVNGWSNTDDLMWMQYRLPEVIASLTAAKEVTAPKVEATDEARRLEEIMNASLLGVGAVTKMQMLSAQQAAPTAPKEPLVVPFETSLPYERNTS